MKQGRKEEAEEIKAAVSADASRIETLSAREKDVEADSPLPLGRDKRGLFRFGKNIREDT